MQRVKPEQEPRKVCNSAGWAQGAGQHVGTVFLEICHEIYGGNQIIRACFPEVGTGTMWRASLPRKSCHLQTSAELGEGVDAYNRNTSLGMPPVSFPRWGYHSEQVSFTQSVKRHWNENMLHTTQEIQQQKIYRSIRNFYLLLQLQTHQTWLQKIFPMDIFFNWK